MQVSVWAAFRGHLGADLEYSAAELSAIANQVNDDKEEFQNEMDFDDPFSEGIP